MLAVLVALIEANARLAAEVQHLRARIRGGDGDIVATTEGGW